MGHVFGLSKHVEKLVEYSEFVDHTLERLISKSKKKYKPKKQTIIALDTEDNGKCKVTLVGIYDGKKYVIFNLASGEHTPRDVVDYIYELGKKGKVLIHCHNLEYDIINLFEAFDYSPIKKLFYSGRLISAELKSPDESKSSNIEFRDTMNYYPVSLKTIGEVMGHKKGNFQDVKDDIVELIEYLKMDCKIEYDFAKGFQDEINEKFGISLGATIGAMAMDLFRRKYLKRDIGACCKWWALEAYYGGRTECFFKGEISNKDGWEIVYIDLKSSYPTSMLDFFGDTSRITKSKGIDDHEYGIGKFKIRVPHDSFIPPLPYRYKKKENDKPKLYFPTGDITAWWTYEEVRNALRFDCEILEFYEGYGTNEGEQFFKGYINDLYNMRKDYEDKIEKKKAKWQEHHKETFWNIILKLFLNNLYGKWGQHSDNVIVTVDPIEDFENKIFDGRATGKNLGPLIVYREKLEEPVNTANYFWAAHITAKSRIRLHNMQHALHSYGHKILYSDTDSIIFYKRPGAKTPYRVSNNMGDWSEKKFVYANFIMSKGYLLRDKNGKQELACKGVPTKFAHDFLIKGKVIFPKPNKMLQGFINETKRNFWENVEKTNCVIPYKRAFKRKNQKSGVLYPISVEQIPEQEDKLLNHLREIEKSYGKKGVKIKNPSYAETKVKSKRKGYACAAKVKKVNSKKVLV